MKRVVIAGGGTGGHIYPGLAIAKELKALGCEVHFVGSVYGLEKELVPKHGFPLHTVKVGQLNLSGWRKIKTLLQLPLALLKSLWLVLMLRPSVVLGVGGYAAGPFVLIASFFTKTAIWEPNAYPGLTNRWLAPFVKKAYLMFPKAASLLKCKSTEILGYPLRKEVEAVVKTSSDKFRLFIFGGSQGARGINVSVSKMIEKYHGKMGDWEVIHQVGRRDFDQMQEVYQQKYDFLTYSEFVYDMDEKLSWADLVICRGGVGSVSEMMATGTASIIIPLPGLADNHQQKNAEVMVKEGAAIMILQSEATPEKLWDVVNQLKIEEEKLQELGNRAKGLHRSEAADKIAESLLQI